MKTKLKDNKIFRLIIIPICIALCIFGKFIPLFPSLSQDANGVIFIFISCLILWLTIGIDWPSLLCIFAIALLKTIGFKNAFINSFGNATFIFLLFTFICTYALSKTSLIRRIAINFINFPLAKKHGYLFVTFFLLAVLLLGLFMSPSVLFVVILPILKEIFAIAKIEKGEKIAKVLMLGLGFTVSISSGMTLIAHVFPVLALQALQNLSVVENVTPLQYMLLAIPVGLVTFGLMLFIFFVIIRPNGQKLVDADVSSLKASLPKINAKDIITLVVFVVVLLLWVVPSLLEKAWPIFYQTINGYTTAMPPLLGTLALLIIRVDGQPILKVDEAFKNVPWGSLLMCAATLLLGAALTNNDIGIKTFLNDNLSTSLQGIAPVILIVIFLLWAAIQTNLSSNMVTATLVSSVAVTVLGAVGQVNIPLLVSLIGLLASFAFATPPSMPHIAIVAGDEYCSTKDVLIYGSILMVISVLVCLGCYYTIGSLVL